MSKEQKIEVRVTKDVKYVAIEDDGYGLNLLICKNGYQTTGTGVTDEIIDMIEEVIKKYKIGRQLRLQNR